MRGLGFLVLAALALGQQRSFVACPIVRDTKTAPCYLAEYKGDLYFLGTQQDLAADSHAPQLKHEVLVEGKVVEGPHVCGGIPLQPVSISVLKEVNLSCNTLLPPEPGMDAPPPLHETATAAPAPLSGRHEFNVLFPFDQDQLEYSAGLAVTEAADYAKRIHASSVKVSGYRAMSLLSNGDRLTEAPSMAEKRAQNIAMLLRGVGVSNVTVEWKSEAEPGDGLTDPSRRRAIILVTP